jgi:hypothetical protein
MTSRDAASSAPDASAPAPDTGTTGGAPDAGVAVPDAGTSMPDAGSAPDASIVADAGSMPDAVTAMPDAVTAMPDAVTAMPDAGTAMPDAGTAMPDAGATGSADTGATSIIPAERMTSWVPGVTVGVQGGIPNRTSICATIDAAMYGNGSTDVSSALGSAIDSCGAGQVVYIPAGTYSMNSGLYRAYASNITIRGAGPGRTILLNNAGSTDVLHFGTSDWPRPAGGVSITSGATQGSSSLTVSNASMFSAGQLVRVEQDDLPYVIVSGAPGTNNRLLSEMHLVTAVSGAMVTVTPPLAFTFTQNPTLVAYALMPLRALGVEDLTIDGNGQSASGMWIEQSWGSWVKNVEIKNSYNRQMFLTTFSGGEVRHNYTHSVAGGGPNHEGIDFYSDGSFNLIEDNITYNGGFPAIILGDSEGGCAGNVIAYNFAYAANVGSPDMSGADISVSHGPHNMMNLVEGNIAGQFQSDGYFGSTSHITVLRNWFTATHPTATTNLMAVSVERWNNYFSLVGNILGTSSFSGGYQPVLSSLSDQDIYKLGFPNMGNGDWTGSIGPTNPPNYVNQAASGNGLQEFDLNVAATMIRHGNYDFYNKSLEWDSTITNHDIPTSFFRSSKPPFFGALAWPPLDPASPPSTFDNANLSRIPAGYRYVNGVDP